MSKVKNRITELLFRVQTGKRLHIANDGKSVNPIVIRYKDYFFEIMLDSETGEPTGDFSWSGDSGMFHTPVREHLVAKEQEA